MYFRFCYQTGKVYVQSGERFRKFSHGFTLNFSSGGSGRLNDHCGHDCGYESRFLST